MFKYTALIGGLSATAFTAYQLGGWLIHTGVEKLTQNVLGGVFAGMGGASEGAIDKFFNKLFERASKMDPLTFSQKLAEAISKSGDAFLKNLGTEKLAGDVGEKTSRTFDTFADGINLGDMGEKAGTMFSDGMKGFSKVFGKGLNDSFDYTFGSLLRQFNFQYFPYILGAGALWVGTPLAIKYLYHRLIHNIGKPQLATEIKQMSMWSFSSPSKSQPIYSKEVTERISTLAQAVMNTRKNGGYFQNVLFYGPGGTGKTMISEYIAQNSGMSYIKMSGGDLAQYIQRGEHVTELNKVMDKANGSWRPWSTRPWVLFIDEAESLCRDRSKITSQALLELQNAFLNRTGTQSKNFMLILATNRMEDLDEAVLSRMDHKIYIGPPAESERTEILKSYVGQFFSKAEQQQFFSSAQLGAIAKNTDGLTGRALFKMLNAIATKKSATSGNKLTQAIIDKTVTEFVEQEKEVERRRALKSGEVIPTFKVIPADAQPTSQNKRAAG